MAMRRQETVVFRNAAAFRTLFTEYTHSDISIDIILQIKKEESCFLSISICSPPFSMLRISEKVNYEFAETFIFSVHY